jgi:hypothetical protein
VSWIQISVVFSRQDFLHGNTSGVQALRCGHSNFTFCIDGDIQPMECLSETKWDVVISGTGLVQSLLALSVLFPALNPDSLF